MRLSFSKLVIIFIIILGFYYFEFKIIKTAKNCLKRFFEKKN